MGIENLDGISIESISVDCRSFIARGHSGGGHYGDEISWCCIISILGDTAVVRSLVVNGVHEFTKKDAINIRRWLREEGIKKMYWSRFNNSEIKEVLCNL